MSKDKISTDLLKCYGFCFDESWCMKCFYFGAVVIFLKKPVYRQLVNLEYISQKISCSLKFCCLWGHLAALMASQRNNPVWI